MKWLNPIDKGYRSLVSAIVLRAVRDTEHAGYRPEAMDFLLSDGCRNIVDLAGVQWRVSKPADVDEARRRMRTHISKHKKETANHA